MTVNWSYFDWIWKENSRELAGCSEWTTQKTKLVSSFQCQLTFLDCRPSCVISLCSFILSDIDIVLKAVNTLWTLQRDEQLSSYICTDSPVQWDWKVPWGHVAEGQSTSFIFHFLVFCQSLDRSFGLGWDDVMMDKQAKSWI